MVSKSSDVWRVAAAAMRGSAEVLLKLLKAGVSRKLRDRYGRTALDWAIARKDGIAADALRAAGAKTGWELESGP